MDSPLKGYKILWEMRKSLSQALSHCQIMFQLAFSFRFMKTWSIDKGNMYMQADILPLAFNPLSDNKILAVSKVEDLQTII